MDLAGWDARYREAPQSASEPNPLLVEAANKLPPGRALDLACGSGRNALWLAQQGWSVTAVDGSPAAIEALEQRAQRAGVTVDTRIADLEKDEFTIDPAGYDLIAVCYYLQRDLFELCKRGVAPGGLVVAIALTAEPGKENSPFRLEPDELRGYFEGWEILHHREGPDGWQHSVAEIVARRP